MLSRSRTVLAALGASSLLVGCGGGITVSFTVHPHTVRLRVGDQLGVHKSLGECGSPWSSRPSVIAAENPPQVGDCSQGTVEFRALGPGDAEIRGALPCRFTGCMAEGAEIPVIVAQK